MAFSPSPSDISIEESEEELKALLWDATRIRLRADVPVGAYLSGGVDSTYIAALVKRHFNNNLHTFSVSFSDQRFDEAPFQEMAVKSLQTEHHSIRITEEDIGEVFPQVIRHTEVPILRTAPAPLYLLSRLVREEGFKVVLTGEGSDEIFAGYDIFKEDQIRRFWARQPDSKIRPLLLNRLYPDIFQGEDQKAGKFLIDFFKKSLGEVDEPDYSHRIRWENTGRIINFFSAEWRQELDKQDSFRRRFVDLLPDKFLSLALAFQGAIHGDFHFPFQLPAFFTRRPDGHGPFRGRPVSFPGLSPGGMGRPAAGPIPPAWLEREIYLPKSGLETHSA